MRQNLKDTKRGGDPWLLAPCQLDARSVDFISAPLIKLRKIHFKKKDPLFINGCMWLSPGGSRPSLFYLVSNHFFSFFHNNEDKMTTWKTQRPPKWLSKSAERGNGKQIKEPKQTPDTTEQGAVAISLQRDRT